MQKALSFLKNNKKIIIFGLFLVALILIIAIKNKDKNGSILYETVSYGEVKSIINLSGITKAIDNVSLRFPNSGNIFNVHVKEGDFVKEGQRMIELDNRALVADLQKAIANLELQKAEVSVSDSELNKDIENAYIDLLNNDLKAYPKESLNDYDVIPPAVVGSYLGKKEGVYEIEIYGSVASSGASFRYTGLETGTSTVNQYSISKLGDLGLYLEFNHLDNYVNTKWVIPIPNNKSTTYFSLLNTYNRKLASRDVADQNVSLEINQAKIKQRQADISKIEVDINQRILRAPFDGIVSYIGFKKGEFANSNDIAVSLISSDNYEIKIQIPEIDLSKIKENLLTEISLDAYKGALFEGYVYSVNPAETKVDGVSVYEAVVYFNVQDERVRSGMTANVSIISDLKKDVLSVGKQFIEKDDLGEFVIVFKNEKEIKTYIETGLVGTNGVVEILNGLKEGDVIIGKF